MINMYLDFTCVPYSYSLMTVPLTTFYIADLMKIFKKLLCDVHTGSCDHVHVFISS